MSIDETKLEGITVNDSVTTLRRVADNLSELLDKQDDKDREKRVSFSVNEDDGDSDKGVFLHFGDARVRIGDDAKALIEFMPRMIGLAEEIAENYAHETTRHRIGEVVLDAASELWQKQPTAEDFDESESTIVTKGVINTVGVHQTEDPQTLELEQGQHYAVLQGDSEEIRKLASMFGDDIVMTVSKAES